MKKPYIVLSCVGATALFGTIAYFCGSATFHPVMNGTGDPTDTGILFTGGFSLATLGSLLATIYALFMKYEQPALEVIKAVTGKDLAAPNTALGELLAAIAAVQAWESKQDDQVLRQQALMAVLALVDKMLDGDPNAQNAINNLANVAVEIFFPKAAPKT